MLVNIYTKEGSIIKQCSLFEANVRNGDSPFTNLADINKAMLKVPWGEKYSSFQSKELNGTIHVNNIERYTIIA
jgi:hypothetical protein